MSITPVREALARAGTVGLVRQDFNRGFTVAELPTDAQYRQLFAARHAIETAALIGSDASHPGEWVANVSDEEIEQLRGLVETRPADDAGASHPGSSRFSLLERSLHQRLIELAGNGFLTDAFECIHFHLRLSRLYAYVGAAQGASLAGYQEALCEHRAIVDALGRRDGSGVVRASDSHAHRAEERFELVLATAALSA